MFEARKDNVSDGISFALETRKRIVTVAVMSLAVFSLLIMSSFPSYTFQMLTASPLYIGEVLASLTVNTYASSGLLGVFLVGVYSIATAFATLMLYHSVSVKGLKNIMGAGSLAPAALIGGCASCGAGILGLMGFMGAVSAFPFGGNLVRFAGLMLVIFYMSEEGNPRTCNI